MSRSPTIPQTPAASSGRARDLAVASAIFILALVIRVGVLFQSLWYDELVTLINYVSQPWNAIVAGAYSPNNHVLFSLLAKLVTPLTGDLIEITAMLRLPSLLAGSALAIALAWPFRKDQSLLALSLAVMAAVHPWLVSLSGWARGYALLLLLAVLATHLLPRQPRWVHWPYALLLAAAAYTQPIALGLGIGHGVAMLVLGRALLPTWMRSAAMAAAIAALLYVPFLFTGARQYWAGPEIPSISYPQFLEQVFRHAVAGDNARNTVFLITPILIIVIGGALAWRLEPLRPALLAFATATVFALLFPLIVPLAGEVRAVPWLIPLFCICAAALVTAPLPSYLPIAAVAALVMSLTLRTVLITRVPAQPIVEAVAIAREECGPDGAVIGIYMAAGEARHVYGGINHVAYRLEADPTSPVSALRDVETGAGPTPVAVIFYENFLQRDQPQLWAYIQQHYRPIARLPGRVSPAAVYRRHQ